MNIANDVLLARIELLRRVCKEHEPVIFRSVPIADKKVELGELPVMTHSFEVNERLLRMGETIIAAHHELDETYRVICITDEMPDDVAVDLLRVRMHDAGGDEAWCEKIRSLKAPAFSIRWLRSHLEAFAKGGIQFDEIVRVALMFEDLNRTRSLEKAA